MCSEEGGRTGVATIARGSGRLCAPGESVLPPLSRPCPLPLPLPPEHPTLQVLLPVVAAPQAAIVCLKALILSTMKPHNLAAVTVCYPWPVPLVPLRCDDLLPIPGSLGPSVHLLGSRVPLANPAR